MADISEITLPNNETYNIKDQIAREHINDTDNPHSVTAEQVRIFYGTSTSVVSSPQEGDICAVYRQNYDSGWIDVTFTSDFQAYSSSLPPKYRRIGNIVNVQGVAKPTTTLAGNNTQVTMFTLPTGFRPFGNVGTICQGSGVCTWYCQVSNNGAVSFGRYRDSNGLASATSSTWLPFNVTFMVS